MFILVVLKYVLLVKCLLKAEFADLHSAVNYFAGNCQKPIKLEMHEY